MLFKMIREIKVSSDRFGYDASLLFLSTSRRCSRNRSPSRLPVSPMYSLLQQVQVMQSMTLAEVHINWSVILMDLLGPDIFSTLWMKGQVLHRERAHLKVPGWSLVWNELLTKKLPMFLSRLNEISGGFETIVSVSESFLSHLDFLRMKDLSAWLWGRNMRVNGMRSVFSFSAVCNADCRSICWARWSPTWTTETG